MKLDRKEPSGPIQQKWDKQRFELKLVNPANRRKYTVVVVGTGLAGAAASASLGEMGYNVINLCIQDSPVDQGASGQYWNRRAGQRGSGSPDAADP